MKQNLVSLMAGAVIAVAAGNVMAQANGAAEKAGMRPSAKPGITAEQRAMLNEKLAIVDKLMRAAGASQAGANVSADRQRWMLESLYKLPVSQLRTMRLQGSPDLLANEIAKSTKVTAKSEQPAFGQTTTELTFLPIQPCRYIDTRNVGGPIVGSRQFDLENAGNVYGGSAACTPITSTVGSGNSSLVGAIAANVAIVSPTAAPGFIGARPVGSTNTTALVNWFEAGPSVQASNAGILAIDQQVAVTNEIEFFGSPTQIIVDVFGVFAAPTATALDCNVVRVTAAAGTVANGAEFAFTDTQRAACAAGYTRVSTSCEYAGPSPVGLQLVQVGNPDPQDVNTFFTCIWRNLSGAGLPQENFNTHTTCCRIPGR